jgi:DNA-binding transcriptional ArsR family regulator
MASWSFLTNHALVLLHIVRQRDSTGLEIAQAVGITERAVRKIVAELQAAGYIEREKIGRRNRYRVDIHRPLRLVGERELTVGELLAIIPDGRGAAAETAGSATDHRPGNLVAVSHSMLNAQGANS